MIPLILIVCTLCYFPSVYAAPTKFHVFTEVTVLYDEYVVNFEELQANYNASSEALRLTVQKWEHEGISKIPIYTFDLDSKYCKRNYGNVILKLMQKYNFHKTKLNKIIKLIENKEKQMRERINNILDDMKQDFLKELNSILSKNPRDQLMKAIEYKFLFLMLELEHLRPYESLTINLNLDVIKREREELMEEIISEIKDAIPENDRSLCKIDIKTQVDDKLTGNVSISVDETAGISVAE